MSYILTDEQVNTILTALFVRGETLKGIESKNAREEYARIDDAWKELFYQSH